MNGGFSVRSDATTGTLLTVSTPVELSYECDPYADTPCNYELPHRWSFTEGQLELVAEDGSTLVLDADTESQETLKITISNDQGVQTIQAEWSEWQPLLSFSRFQADSSEWVSAQSLASAELDARPAIRPENYSVLLDHVFDIITGYNALGALDTAQHFLDDAEPDETSQALGVRTDIYVCDSTGAATALRVDNDESLYPLDYHLRFDQCEYGGFEFDGEMRGQEIRQSSGVVGIDNATLQWRDDSGYNYNFQGQSSVQRTGSGATKFCSWEADRIGLYAQSDVLAENVTTGRMQFEARGSVETGVVSTLSSDFSVTSEKTEGFEISGRAELEISNDAGLVPGNWTITKGSISLRAYDKSSRWSSDRSSLVFEVEDSVIEIVNSEGSYTIDVPWTTWQSHAQSALDRVCGSEQ